MSEEFGPFWLFILQLLVINGGLVTAVRTDNLLFQMLGSGVSVGGVLWVQKTAYERGKESAYDD